MGFTLRFQDKVAIVTGGSSGIGAATVQRLVREGARVLIADLNPPQETSDAVAFHRTDVTSPTDATAMVEAAVALFGRVDVLVNNAGIGCLDETPDLDPVVWNRVFDVNVSAVFYVCRAAIPVMARQGGAIVNIASVSGLAGDYGFTAYNASKAALINYTRSLALDCAHDGIRVNALCPGTVAGTAMGVGAHGSAADRQAWLDPIPLGRMGTVEEMANIIAFLASNEASYMTGSIVVADGGTTAHTGQPNIIAQRARRREEAAGKV
ncbi:3-oxoacyl-ACP reductase [Acidocella aquatica]|uniref:3-oxoacyl-ACP reductase n=1 Tax=Acidocella aquatica TaxID=1922313 RepID=A0ABQ6A6I4_9PROT|nr:SDR family oxidoreductase [Acidocella aquatica]GLR67466.1 3-oxoacyl-ACP reductase [Acidocella aquatica]